MEPLNFVNLGNVKLAFHDKHFVPINEADKCHPSFVTMELMKLNQAMNCVHTLYFRLFEFKHLMPGLNKLINNRQKNILD